jgi:hypothetical protein
MIKKIFNRAEIALLAYFSLIGLFGLVSTYAMLSVPSEPRNQVFLGFSSARLAAGGGIFAASMFFLFLGIKAFRKQDWAKRAWRNSPQFSNSRQGTESLLD